MNPQDIVDFGREATITCLTLAAPILVIGLVVGIVIGIIQSMTHVQDQTAAFVPKIVLIGLTFVFCLPWLTDNIMQYSKTLFEKPLVLARPLVELRETENGINEHVKRKAKSRTEDGGKAPGWN